MASPSDTRPVTTDVLGYRQVDFAAFFEASTEGFILFDENANLLCMNRAAQRLVGISESDAKQLLRKHINLVDLLPGLQQTLRHDRCLHGMETAEPFTFNNVTQHTEHGDVPLNVNVFNVGNGLGVVVNEGIGRKPAEEALKASGDKYRLVVENAGEAIMVAQDGLIKFANSRALELTGYSMLEMAFRPFQDLIYPGDRGMVMKRHLGRSRGEDVPQVYPYRIVRKDGRARWVETNTVAVAWGGRPATLSFITDITERKLLESKMVEYKELDRLKTNLLSTVSHELRTPLATIKGYCTMLLDYEDRLDGHEKRDYLQSVDKATDRLTELVDHLLDMSRLDAGQMKLKKSPASLSKLVWAAVEEARIRAPNHKIKVELERRLPMVKADGRRIRQVLDNLFDNSCKYSGEGTEVVVSARRTGSELLVEVSDQGMGIPADEMEKVFDRMHRIEQRVTHAAPGTGLGLAICKGLVESHGGRIWVASEEGKGSTFYFTIPLQARKELRSNVKAR